MYHMIMLIISNLEDSFTILDAWEENGVPGVTIMEGTGLGGVRKVMEWEEVPFIPSLLDFMRGREQQNRIFMTVVEGEEMVNHIIQITQNVVGSLDEDENGVLFVLPVSRVVGLSKVQQSYSDRKGD
jgi:nitrogen regulatory protein PII